jgi:hypothetical protein
VNLELNASDLALSYLILSRCISTAVTEGVPITYMIKACLTTVGEAPHSTKDIRAASSLSGEWPLDFKERLQDRNAANATLTRQIVFYRKHVTSVLFIYCGPTEGGHHRALVLVPIRQRCAHSPGLALKAEARHTHHWIRGPPAQPPHVMDQPDPFHTLLAEEERGARAEARAGEQLRCRDNSTDAKYAPSRSTEGSQCGVQARPVICIP